MCRIAPSRILIGEIFLCPLNQRGFIDLRKSWKSSENPYLDRHSIQKLFRVQERRARQLMAGLPGMQVGNAVAISRSALLSRLEETAAGGLFQEEVKRRARVVEELDRTRRQLAARRIRFPLPRIRRSACFKTCRATSS